MKTKDPLHECDNCGHDYPLATPHAYEPDGKGYCIKCGCPIGNGLHGAPVGAHSAPTPAAPVLRQLKVMPCPNFAGKHPYHDARWIVTADAEVEYSNHVENDWRLAKGSAIAQMRDCENQADYARLFAAAPALRDACAAALPVLIEARERWSNGEDCYSAAEAKLAAALALAGAVALQMCKEWNAEHDPGFLSDKAEFEEA